jgi:rhodanese-related sulfurtransferase
LEFPVDTALPSISRSELAIRLGRPGAPLLLDVRRRERFSASTHMLAGARYCAPEDVAAFAASQPPGEVVAYCVYGHNVSEDAVRTLRAAGWNARRLAGGYEGGEPGVDAASDVEAWRAHPLPRLRKRPDLGVTGEAPSRWITRSRPKIDRVACPWLIRRFIDPRAQFHYAPTEQVFAQASALQAVPYDIPDAPITHVGADCSFDALIAAFELEDAALHALATIVRGADTDRPELAPQSAGLLAISLGLSQLHANDDHAMLAAALPVYDALYAWCRDAHQERHNWVLPEAPGGAA